MKIEMNPDFDIVLNAALERCGLALSDEKKKQLNIYDQLLAEWNERMNLTALTSPGDVALKHFCDCLMLTKFVKIEENASVIDVGTGAGFPGLVLKIAREDLRLTLLDSLQKRLVFLEEVCEKADINGVELLHARAEDASREEAYREQFDVAVSRAVAPLNVLCEYCLPYVRMGGVFLAMKAKEYEDELKAAENALRELGGTVEDIQSFILPDAGQRAIVCIRKTAPTPEKYPRTSKKIKTKPL